MTKLLIPVILQLVGVAVIIAEFIVPTAGVLAALSIVIFGYSLYFVFAKVSVNAGIVFTLLDLAMIPVLVIVGIKMLAASKATLRDTLSSKDGAGSQPPEWSAIAGREGLTLSPLHPAGSALIDGMKYDVVSRGEFIDRGTPVVVTVVDGNRIVVKKKQATL